MMIFLAWLHIVAAVTWIGGMLFLSLVLVPALKQDPMTAQRSLLFRNIGVRFRLIVWVSAATLLTTGPLLLSGKGGSLMEPSGWPPVLLVKFLLVLALLTLSATHDFLLGPRVAQILRAPAHARTRRERALVDWSPWLPRLSALLALAVLFTATVLTRL